MPRADRLSWFTRLATCLMVVLVALIASHRVGTASESGWQAAAAPDAILIMRHALAPGTGDPADFDVSDCGTQRNLDDRGRTQAQAIGNAMRGRDIRFDRVLSSAWCRCQETARLLQMGSIEVLPALNSFYQEFQRREGQTAELKSFLEALPKGQRVMLVTHQVNITALTGAYARSGEVLVLRRQGDRFEITGRMLIDP